MKFTIVMSLICLFVSTGCKKEPVINSAPPAVLPLPRTPTPPHLFEYDLDLKIHAGYKFFDNAEMCDGYCYYADQTRIEASVRLSSSENLQVNIFEDTDSASQAYNVNYGYTAFRLSDQLYASGPSSYNLKESIQQGGGTFSYTIQLDRSSALGTRRTDAFRALPPLTVTGNLDTITHTVNMQIKGKIIF